jgi:hypothetical protein
MPSHLDLTSLTKQVADAKRQHGHRWTIAHDPATLRVHVTLTPVGFTDVYCLRLDYGESLSSGPPSVAFCDPETFAEGRLGDWPRGLTEFFKVPPQNGVSGWICNPWTREGRAHHPEWQAHGWRPKRALWTVATAIQDILDKPGAYMGRTVV